MSIQRPKDDEKRDCTPEERAWLLDLPGDHDPHGAEAAALWRLHGEWATSEYAKAHPGRRPWAWWQHAAPEPMRRRLGGTGTPMHECLRVVPYFDFGLPTLWVDQWLEDYYNGRKLDVHGQRIGTQYHEGQFKGRAVDWNDPPVFESQSAYLKRLQLFLPGEARRVSADAYLPEAIRPRVPKPEPVPARTKPRAIT
jgi:hypothetical protein